MKCSKCGAECKESQTYCLKCGNRLHPDSGEFLGMEEELANSVGALLDGIEDEEEDEEIEEFFVQLDDDFFEDEQAKKVHDDLQVDNIYSGSRKTKGTSDREYEEEHWEYDEDKYFDDMQTGSLEESEEYFDDEEEEQPKKTAHKKTQEKKNEKKKAAAKKKIAITCTVIGILLAICISGGLYVFNNVHFHLTSYGDYYRVASHEFKRDKYRSALKDAQTALRKAELALQKAGDDDDKQKKAKEQIVQVRELINDIYEKSGKLDDDYADNMREIVANDSSKTEYFVKLAKYYKENKPPKELTDFLRTVEDDNTAAIKSLKDYIVTVPDSDKESGQYTGQFAVTLTCEENCTIWYTTDGSDPSVHGVEYTEPVKITNFRTLEDEDIESGITELKVIARNADSVESKIETFTYEIVLASAEPVVTPDSGQYSEYTEIKVVVPEGSKCYYTIGEGSAKPADPDENATLYVASVDDLPEGTSEEEKAAFKPLEIPRGTHIMKFVIIDEYGIASDIAVRSYTLSIPRNVTLQGAEELVQETMLTDNVTLDLEGHNVAGNIVTAEWEESVELDNQEYYIVNAIERTVPAETETGADGMVQEGTEVSRSIYAVNSYDKTVIKDLQLVDGTYIFPAEEETEETTTQTP